MPDAVSFRILLPAAAALVVAVALIWALLRFATRAIHRLRTRMEQDGMLEEGALFAKRLIQFVRSSLSVIVALIAGVVMLRSVGVRGTPRISTEELVTWLMGPGLRLLTIATGAYLIARALHLLIDSLQIFLVSRDASQTDLLERKKRIDTLGQLLRVVATLLVIGVAVLMALSLFNVDIRPILTGAGIAGLAVGFGAQNLVRDIIAGFFLILENQVRLGDVVSINGKSGLVEAIRLRTIALRSFDGTVHVIPNGVITELSNMTKDFSYAVLDLTVPYDVNVDAMVEVMQEVAKELRSDPVHGPNILEPLDVSGIESFGEGTMLIRARMKTIPIQQWNVARAFRRRLKSAFEQRGISFPTRYMSLRLEDAPRMREAASAASSSETEERRSEQEARRESP